MEAVIIAVTGTITAIGVLYKTYVELQKKLVDNRSESRQKDIDEFLALLQGYKDLKSEYEEQVKSLKEENKILKSIVQKLEARVRELERILAKEQRDVKKLKLGQAKLQEEIEEVTPDA